MKVKDCFINFGESILGLKIKGVYSFEDIVDFFLVMAFPVYKDLGKLLNVSHCRVGRKCLSCSFINYKDQLVIK